MQRPGRTAAWLFLVVLFSALLAPAATSQALRPGVTLTQPAPSVSTGLDALRTPDAPQVTLLSARNTAEHVPGARQAVEEAVYYWELLLLGLRVPYRVVDDAELGRDVPGGTRLLILPAAEALSSRQRREIQRFVERGGGVIASGRVGLFDDRGRAEGPGFFRELFGAEYITNLPEQPYGILQSIDGGHPVSDGVPMGFRLNLAPQQPLAAAQPISSVSVGRTHPYGTSAGPDPFANVTLALYGRHGRGRVVWTRFQPQDVSREAEQQYAYQGFVLNAMAYAAGVPSVAVRPWPNGRASATVFAALPSIGTGLDYLPSMHRAVDALAAAEAPGTFFLTTREATQFPDLVERITATGEAAVSANTDDVLKKQPYSTQLQRLEAAQSDLRRFGGAPVVGLYPPGGFYDAATLVALRETGFRYLLQPAVVSSLAPHLVDFTERADYRAAVRPGSEAVFASNTATAAPRATPSTAVTTPPPYAFSTSGRDDYTILSVLNLAGNPAAQAAAYREDFSRVHEARGVYVLPYHAELQALTPERANVLTELAVHARRAGSWVTTFRTLYDWWTRREQVSVLLSGASDEALTFEVEYRGNEPLQDVGFDVRLPAAVRAASATGGAEAIVGRDGQTVTVTLPSLRPGTTRLSVSLNR